MNNLPATIDLGDPDLSWQPPDAVSWPDLRTRQWLTHPGSLTHQLKLTSGDDFRVQVLAEGELQLANAVLRGEFGPLAADHPFWSRKVLLQGKGQDWVQAHTLLPGHSQLSPLVEVMSLGRKPLGEFLFNHPLLTRSHLHITRSSAGVWGRKSLFFLYRKPIMVAEFFLGELLAQDPPRE
ncbi:unnamed protein product [Discosporangium mesarthrocarpum]